MDLEITLRVNGQYIRCGRRVGPPSLSHGRLLALPRPGGEPPGVVWPTTWLPEAAGNPAASGNQQLVQQRVLLLMREEAEGTTKRKQYSGPFSLKKEPGRASLQSGEMGK